MQIRPAPALFSIDAVMLAGGLGTRLQTVVSDRPKPLAAIQGRPFLDLLVDDLLRQGLRRIVLCISHQREQIVEHCQVRRFTEGNSKRLFGGPGLHNAQSRTNPS